MRCSPSSPPSLHPLPIPPPIRILEKYRTAAICKQARRHQISILTLDIRFQKCACCYPPWGCWFVKVPESARSAYICHSLICVTLCLLLQGLQTSYRGRNVLGGKSQGRLSSVQHYVKKLGRSWILKGFGLLERVCLVFLFSWPKWCTPLIPAPVGRGLWIDLSKFQDRLLYIASSMPARVT